MSSSSSTFESREGWDIESLRGENNIEIGRFISIKMSQAAWFADRFLSFTTSVLFLLLVSS
jgi:hypothetical protein